MKVNVVLKKREYRTVEKDGGLYGETRELKRSFVSDVYKITILDDDTLFLVYDPKLKRFLSMSIYARYYVDDEWGDDENRKERCCISLVEEATE